MRHFIELIKNNNVRYFFIFAAFPILCNSLLSLIVLHSFQTIIEFTSSLIFLYIITKLFSITKGSYIFFLLWIFIIYPICLISILFTINFCGDFSQSVINSILETNINEAFEVLSREFSITNLLITLCFFLFAVLSYKKYLLFKQTSSSNLFPKQKRLKQFKYISFLALYVFIPKSLSCKPLYSIKSCLTWYKEHKNIQRYFSFDYLKCFQNFSDVTLLSKQNSQTFIFVIGESVDRKHMGIYGYTFNNTTPRFNNMQHELYVFNNVTSCDIWTSSVLSKIFVFDKFKNGNIISLFKQAGFKTYWISNQYSTGKYDTTASFLSKLCDSCIFITNSDALWFLKSNYDENLLPHIEDALNDKIDKKVIFVHLIGSHTNYKNRYPKSFKVFKMHDIKYSEKKAKTVAEYDNSILYTDYVLTEILNLLKSQNTYSAMIYMSDHGEDVYDTKESICGRSSNKTNNMDEIPFVIWVSEQYKNDNINFIKNWNFDKKYSSENFAHSISDLFRISHEKFNASKSIFR